MIIEVAIITAGVVSIFGSSLGFAYRILKMQAKEDAENDPLNERRRVLERQRATWIKAANEAAFSDERLKCLLKAAEVDQELIKLAAESADPVEPIEPIEPVPPRVYPDLGDVIKARG